MGSKDLIYRCKQHERKAQEELYKLYSPKLFGVCLKYSENYQQAEDNLQDGFVTIFEKIGQFQDKGSFEGWMRRIVVNTALKNYNKSSFKKEKIGLQDYQEGTMDPDVIASLYQEELLKVIEELPNGYRIVFNLYVIEGFSHKEIAKELDIQESTSRSQLVKARKMLQSKISQIMRIVA